MLNIQKHIALGSGDFSPTYNLHAYIFLLRREAQAINKQELFQANTLLVGLKSPLPKEHL
jgi:hypothetical protein